MAASPPATRALDDIEGFLARHEAKELVRFTTVGSVDDGKSTLIGRMLHDCGAVYDDQLRAVRKATKGRATEGIEEEIDFSLFTDGLLAEREQGITIDVAYRYFSTDKRKFIIADTPGHEQYTRNMATGASTADIAIILLDARLGVLPQSRRHAAIASLLGIAQLIVAVNKMDLVGYEQAAFDQLAAQFRAFTDKLGFDAVSFVPVSAKRGDNVVTRMDRMPWYRGDTLLGLLDSLPVRRAEKGDPFRFPVQTVVRPDLDYRGFAGWVAAGVVQVGDEVVALPSGTPTRIEAIDTWSGPLSHAHAPLAVTLRLADEVDVSRGEMIAPRAAPPTVSTDITASLVWVGERPFEPRRKLILKHTSRWVPARVVAIEGKLSLETLELEPSNGITMNDIVVARLYTTRPIFCDPYQQSRATGAFILVDALDNATVAAGMIRSAEAMLDRRNEGHIGADERAKRIGHRAAVVRLPQEGARLERALFDQGVNALALEPHVVSPQLIGALCAAGVVALVHGLEDAAFEASVAELAGAQVIDLRFAPGDPCHHVLSKVSLLELQTGGSGI